MQSICVFCGSSSGKKSIYKESAVELGQLMAQKNYELIYGGGSIGLMGIIADTIMNHQGTVTGVIPQFLYDLEVGHDGVSNLIIVDSMHERKQRMAELADAFVAMPGGIGTLEELFEIFTWSQLKLVNRPVFLLNVNGYFDGLIQFLDSMVKEGFFKQHTRNTLIVENDPFSLINTIDKLKDGTGELDLEHT